MMIEREAIDSLRNDDLAKGVGVKASFLCLELLSQFLLAVFVFHSAFMAGINPPQVELLHSETSISMAETGDKNPNYHSMNS